MKARPYLPAVLLLVAVVLVVGGLFGFAAVQNYRLAQETEQSIYSQSWEKQKAAGLGAPSKLQREYFERVARETEARKSSTP